MSGTGWAAGLGPLQIDGVPLAGALAFADRAAEAARDGRSGAAEPAPVTWKRAPRLRGAAVARAAALEF